MDASQHLQNPVAHAGARSAAPAGYPTLTASPDASAAAYGGAGYPQPTAAPAASASAAYPANPTAASVQLAPADYKWDDPYAEAPPIGAGDTPGGVVYRPGVYDQGSAPLPCGCGIQLTL